MLIMVSKGIEIKLGPNFQLFSQPFPGFQFLGSLQAGKQHTFVPLIREFVLHVIWIQTTGVIL
jgi:hypothetical protein